jgi:phage-related protein
MYVNPRLNPPRRKFRIVTFYKTADGRKPVGDWLQGLDDERAQAVAIGLRFFEEYPNPVVPKKFFEKVTDHIWEIKCHYGKEQFRLLAFPDGDAVVIAVHGFAKKSMDLKDRDLELAEERRKDYLRRKSS